MLSEIYQDIATIKTAISNLLLNSHISNDYFTNKSVLIKPNWVRHCIKEADYLCLTTHPNFILAVLEIILEQKPCHVIIADAPIQGCDWDKLLDDSFLVQIKDYSSKFSIPISVIDFRRTLFRETKRSLKQNIRDMTNYLIFDLGGKSYLEPISSDKSQFRVTDYNPDCLSETHRMGKHLYCIAKEIFDVDCVVAIPKAKTHQKTGITNALKLMVGINGDKDYLPHHRVGGDGSGGDCYPGKNYLLRLAEFYLDQANRNIGKSFYTTFKLISKFFWKLSIKSPEHSLSGAWYGNDTTWRMVMDINLITRYGTKYGTLSEAPQRSILYICDGIIGGQGDGPLHPDPLPLGVVMVSENPALMDRALAILMGFNPDKFPLLNTNEDFMRTEDSKLMVNGLITEWDSLRNISIPTNPPPGWVKYLSN